MADGGIAVPWVALIDDETAQTIFVLRLVVAPVGGDAILSGRRGEKAGAGDDDGAFLIVPLILAVLVANVVSSGDAERAALVPLAIVLVALWRLARGRHPSDDVAARPVLPATMRRRRADVRRRHSLRALLRCA